MEYNNLLDLDVVIKNAVVIDASQDLDGNFDLGIKDGKIAAIAPKLPPYRAKQTIDAWGYFLSPGWIDLHVHVYKSVTAFGLCADDVGINSGVTTVVDQGSSGFCNFAGFKSGVVEKVKTDVRSFLMLNHAPNKTVNLYEDFFEDPERVEVERLVDLVAANSNIIKGFKVFGESGIISRWGMKLFELARQVGDRTKLPLYMHTGELFPVMESNRPHPERVVPDILNYMQSGDIIGHCYSCQHDGVMGKNLEIPSWLTEAIGRGIRLDVGHGVKFSFEIARRLMERGIFPHTISSDVHGNHKFVGNDSELNYSLAGTVSKLMALGWDLASAIAAITYHPALVLQESTEIGTLQVGSRADLTLFEREKGDWEFFDSLGQSLIARERIFPVLVFREGKLIQPNCRLLRDVRIPSICTVSTKA